MLGLPGSAYLYQGQELGLPEVLDLPDELRQDPAFLRTGESRDGCRVPLPWSGQEPPYGFSTGTPHLPQPAGWGPLSAEAQAHDPSSTFALYKRALAKRGTIALADAGVDILFTMLNAARGGAIEGCREKTGVDPVLTLKKALDNVKPTLEVRSRRVGGATYQVPVEVKAGRATTLALRWLINYSRARREKTMTERLMNEILDASNGLGAAVKRREDTHKMAESNKAFAHYRW